MKACFVAGTPIRTLEGSKAVELFRAGDLVLSRDELDPNGAVAFKRVLRTFVRVSPILNLRVGGRIIGTTAEHPFFVRGKVGRCSHASSRRRAPNQRRALADVRGCRLQFALLLHRSDGAIAHIHWH